MDYCPHKGVNNRKIAIHHVIAVYIFIAIFQIILQMRITLKN